ncbi:MAG: hypothetical protein K6G07_04620 [Lachnospiraceae bacterium]|nr:hypothetical protein [Lachnospiraceae bacterium]
MHVYKELYCDEKCKKKKQVILHRIRVHAGLAPSVYLITLAGSDDYFDILPGYVLKQKQYPIDDLYVMGMADGYDSAVELVQEMIRDFSEQFETVYFKEQLWGLF